MPEIAEIDALVFASVVETLEAYSSGRSTPTDIVEAYLDRASRHGGRYAAYVCLDAARARLAAQAATQRWHSGTARMLEGVPIAVKDLMDVAGLPTLAGSLTRPTTPAQASATVVMLLEQAGAIVLGKTHTEEYAFGSWGINESMGTPVNPWSAGEHLVPGGSSSGSAVAVAAGLAPWAIGTDTGGSVRGPAAWQGLVGYKPTPGRISTHGVVPLSTTLDSVGVLCRTVADALLFVRTVQGPDELDASTWEAPNDDVGASLEQGAAGLCLAVLGDDDRVGISPEVLQAYDDVLAAMVRAGARLQPLELPFTLRSLANTTASPVMAVEAYAQYGHLADDPASALSSPVRARLLAGKMDARTYVQLGRENENRLRQVKRAARGSDAIVLPTMPFAPIPVASVDQTVPATVLTRFVNQLGWCGIALPSGLTAEGLPVSVQCVARPHNDAMAFRVAREIERIVPVLPRPPMVVSENV